MVAPVGSLTGAAAGTRRWMANDIDENVILGTFCAWRIELMQRMQVPSDTRTLSVLLVRLVRP
jgi:hypothetical protein